MRKLRLFVGVLLACPLIFAVSCVTKEAPVTETYYETEYKTEYKTETYTATEDVVVSTSEGKTHLPPVKRWGAGIYSPRWGSGAYRKAVGASHGITFYYDYELDSDRHTRSQVEINVMPIALKIKGTLGAYDLTGIDQIPMKPTVFAQWMSLRPSMTPKEQQWLDDLNAIVTNPERALVDSIVIDTGTTGELTFDAKGVSEFAILFCTHHANPIQNVQMVWSDDIIEQRTVTKERQVPYQVPVQVEKQRTVMETKKVAFWEAILGE